MKANFRLAELLTEYDLNDFGIRKRLAAELGVSRQLIAKLYNNDAPCISFDLLSRLCTWLEKNGVPRSILPGALFDLGRAKLWDAIAQYENVTVYLGEKQSVNDAVINWRWLSRRDSAVASAAVQQLSLGSPARKKSPRISFKYLPYSFSPESDEIDDERLLQEDLKQLSDACRELKASPQPGGSILIGSQRINRLVEVYISDLFACKPFEQPSAEVCVPFFSVFRPNVQYMPSCFGGPLHPSRRKDRDRPGLHYINQQGRWATLPWVMDKRDAGVVVLVQDLRKQSITMAIFGLTGRATEAIGEQLILMEDRFWPPTAMIKGRKVGIYVCGLLYGPLSAEDAFEGKVCLAKCDVIELTEKTLKRYLKV